MAASAPQASCSRWINVRVGIGSWTYGWWSGVAGYPQPEVRLTPATLIGMAKELGVGGVQIADNLPGALDQVATLCACGIDVEIGTRGTDPSHLLVKSRVWPERNCSVP